MLTSSADTVRCHTHVSSRVIIVPHVMLTARPGHHLCVQELAAAGRFGRALPADEQAFVLLTDSVAKQLDALKNDAALSQPVRRFLGKGLDACGPAGDPSVFTPPPERGVL